MHSQYLAQNRIPIGDGALRSRSATFALRGFDDPNVTPNGIKNERAVNPIWAFLLRTPYWPSCALL